MKKKLIYVGHIFHLLTGSTRFFLDLMRERFEVETIVVDPANIDGAGILEAASKADVVALLQLDFLGAIFMTLGIPTVVIPMFDGSENMPPLHWELLNQARFISFSRHLHAKIERAEGHSLLVKYFPEPIRTDGSRRSGLHGFFWERRPDTAINFALVRQLVGENFDSLHVHRASDLGKPPVEGLPRRLGKTKITSSTWFKDKSMLGKILDRSNVYFAPRLSEGIGMGFLEAMARGMAVVANDTSTHNEYICNHVNGILYEPHNVGGLHIDAETADELGAAAQQTVADGRRAWEAQIPGMLDWIESTPKPDANGIDFEVMAREIPKAYMAGFGVYSDFLRRNRHVVRKLSPALDAAREMALETSLLEEPVAMGAHSSMLESARLSFGGGAARRFLGRGWSHDEESFVWMEGTSAVIRFSAAPPLRLAKGLSIRCFGPSGSEMQSVALVMNGALAGHVNVGPDATAHYVPLDEGVIQETNELRLFAERAANIGGDPRRISVALVEIAFE